VLNFSQIVVLEPSLMEWHASAQIADHIMIQRRQAATCARLIAWVALTSQIALHVKVQPTHWKMALVNPNRDPVRTEGNQSATNHAVALRLGSLTIKHGSVKSVSLIVYHVLTNRLALYLQQWSPAKREALKLNKVVNLAQLTAWYATQRMIANLARMDSSFRHPYQAVSLQLRRSSNTQKRLLNRNHFCGWQWYFQ
jgi:hypothetical protein